MKEWYQMNEEEVLKMLDADKNGLSSERAEELLKMNGENVLQESKKKSALRVFASSLQIFWLLFLLLPPLFLWFQAMWKARLLYSRLLP